jgi:tripartite-type tricarboxylate transporter receptor subunit TctC
MRSLIVLALCVPLAALGQAFPSKSIRMIIPFAPGGVDVTARLLQPRMQEDLGQPIVIENRPGAGGVTGSLYVAKSPPDGYTIMMNASGPLIVAPVISKNVPFDTLRDFTPITVLLQNTNMLVVRSGLPATSVRELIDHAKRSGTGISYASTGVGTNQHLDGELFKRAAGIDMVHVPYKGFGPVLQDLIAGQIDVAFMVMTVMKPQLGSSKLRVIAIADASRYAGLPGVPTIAETLPTFRKTPTWTGAIFGPAGLPQPIVARLYAATMKAVNAPEVRPKLEESGVIVGIPPEEFATMLRNDIEATTRAVKPLGIQLDD